MGKQATALEHSPPAVLAPAPAPAPALSARSGDDALRGALTAQPGLVELTHAQAQQAYTRIMREWFAPMLGIGEFWWRFTDAMNTTRPGMGPTVQWPPRDIMPQRIKQLRLALDARDTLDAIAADLPHVTSGELAMLGRVRDCPAEIGQRVRQVTAAHPGMAAFQARRDADAERARLVRQAGQEQINEAARSHQAKVRTEVATVLLRRLAREGVTLSVEAGELKARPMVLLCRADRSELLEYCAELTELVSAPAELIA